MYIFIFFLLFNSLLPINTSASTEYCKSVQPLRALDETKQSIEEKIKKFSNKKVIAQEADATLSKLIAANSPTIIHWIEKRNLQSKPEEEIVYEWRDYYAKNFILGKYPHNDHQINQEIESLVNEINKSFATKKFREKMQKIFTEAKAGSISTIQAFPVEKFVKNKIIKRIQAIQLNWFEDLKKSKSKIIPLEFLDWGIAYDPIQNKINIGVHALAYSEKDTIVAIFAHEIGHAFDSCRWGAFFTGDWPFQKIASCLRGENSVGAKRRDSSKLDQFISEGKLSTEIAEGLKINPTCNRQVYPPIGVQADQLPESFADWFSAEVMARQKKINILSIRNDLCEERELLPGSSYPSNSSRLTKIYFAHPKLRNQMNGKNLPTSQYCNF